MPLYGVIIVIFGTNTKSVDYFWTNVRYFGLKICPLFWLLTVEILLAYLEIENILFETTKRLQIRLNLVLITRTFETFSSLLTQMVMLVGMLLTVKTVGMIAVGTVESATSVALMVTVAQVTSMKSMETVRLRWNWP